MFCGKVYSCVLAFGLCTVTLLACPLSGGAADGGREGFYLALEGEFGVPSFGQPSVKSVHSPGVSSGVSRMVGVRKSMDKVVNLTYMPDAPLTLAMNGFNVRYAPKYEEGFGTGIALGYSMGRFNAQISAHDRSFAIDASGYDIPKNANYFAFAARAPGDGHVRPLSFIGYAEGVQISSVEFDVCYSFLGLGTGAVAGSRPFSFYSCLGSGMASVDYSASHGKIAWLWSAKAGVRYKVIQRVSLFAEAYYRDVVSGDWGKVDFVSSYQGTSSSFKAVFDINYFGAIGGVRFALGGK